MVPFYRMSVDRWCLPLIGYSPLWRSYRRNFHQFFNQREVHKYQHIQLRGCRVFLQRILDNPSELNQQINLYATLTSYIVSFQLKISVQFAVVTSLETRVQYECHRRG